MTSSLYLFPNVNDPDVVPFELERKLGLVESSWCHDPAVAIHLQDQQRTSLATFQMVRSRLGWIVYEPNAFVWAPTLVCRLAVELRKEASRSAVPMRQVLLVFCSG